MHNEIFFKNGEMPLGPNIALNKGPISKSFISLLQHYKIYQFNIILKINLENIPKEKVFNFDRIAFEVNAFTKLISICDLIEMSL